jgi:hypothetical protein
MAGVDITSNVSWSQDEDYYYASVQVRAPDGQVGTIEVKVDRDWVIRAAQMLKRRLMTTAPAGVDVGAWHNPSDPERFVKLCQFVAGKEVKRQLTEQIQRDGIVIAPWFGEWTTATADAAYRLILAAQNDDEASIQQLERIRECAEGGDPAAAKALGMINSVAKLVARGLPAPSVIATRMPTVGALPARRPAPSRRAAPPRRMLTTSAPQPRSGPMGRNTPAATTSSSAASPARAATIAARPYRATAVSPAAAILPVIAPQYPYGFNPYGSPYDMMPSGGGGGGGDFPDGGSDEGDGFDDASMDDGTYYEEPQPEDVEYPDDAPQYEVGEFPEEIAQSQQEEDEPPPDDDGGSPDGPFPGEGTVATRT